MLRFNRKVPAAMLALLAVMLCSCPTDQANDTPSPTDAVTAHEPNHEGQVLRHAVFFSFKETSSDSDIQGVVDAFRALPEKIDSIVEFQSGTNNGPEDLHDGFTHCFLLTFPDDAGRQTYIPHPAHAGEFADVLRPHMDKVFVIDYWGTPYEPMQQELKHALFLKFRDDAPAETLRQIEAAFEALPSEVSAIKHSEWGINNSPERNDHGFTHCFMTTFDSEEGREAYLSHPAHKAFADALEPAIDKTRVLDFWGERP